MTLHRTPFRRAQLSVVLGLALGAALALSASAVQAEPTAAPTKCGVLTSLHWSSKTAGDTLSGTRYTVVAEGYSCALARKLVPGLIKQKGTPFGRTLRGPAGYTCMSDIGGDNPRAIAGVCHRAGGKSFSWGPKVK
jgi:hypothetical protein